MRFAARSAFHEFVYHKNYIIIGPPKQDRKQSIKTKTIGPSVFTLIFFRMWVCRFVRVLGSSLISHELLDKTYIYTYLYLYNVYANHQNELKEGIKMMFLSFICRFNVYFSSNQRKCSQNGEEGNLKI